MTAATQANPATTQVHRVYIKATPEAIWTAITDPAWTARYGYGGRAEYELRPGGGYRAHASEEFLAVRRARDRRGRRGRSRPTRRAGSSRPGAC